MIFLFLVFTWSHKQSKIQNRKTPEFLSFTGYKTSLIYQYILLKVFNSIAFAVFKTGRFEFRSFTMAARRLSRILKKFLIMWFFTIGTVEVLREVLMWQNAYLFMRVIWPLFVAEVNSRCFHWFPTAMLEPKQLETNMASPYGAL